MAALSPLSRPPSATSILDEVAELSLDGGELARRAVEESMVEGLPACVSSATRLYLASAGITCMSSVQRLALPPALAGSDVLARGKTGTGKTLGFLLPCVERLARSPRSSPGALRCVIMAHTRELAAQIVVECEKVCAAHALTVRCVTGGKSVSHDSQSVLDVTRRGSIDFLVATPGRLGEHLESTAGFAERLSGCEVAVLDEADELFSGGFARLVTRILSATAPATRQTLCFSATLPETLLAELDKVMRPTRVLVDDANLLAEQAAASAVSSLMPRKDVSSSSTAPCSGTEEDELQPRVAEAVAVLARDADALRTVLLWVAGEMRANPDGYKIVVFFATAKLTQFAAAAFQQPLEQEARRAIVTPDEAGGGEPSSSLQLLEIHSKLSQAKRDRAADVFRQAKTAVLCTSDVSARGVDYPDVSLVVQCAAPSSREAYVHRLGRTGRAGKHGRGLLVLHDFERSFLQELAASHEGAGGAHVRDISCELEEQLLRTDVALDAALRASCGSVDDALAAATRDAFLSHYTQRKKLTGLTKEQLVHKANAFAVSALWRGTPPPIDADFAKSLGLLTVKGLELTSQDAHDSNSSAAKKIDGGAEAVAARQAAKLQKASDIRAAKIAAGLLAKEKAAEAKRAKALA